MKLTYLLAGGDRRQFWLSRLLVSRSRVYTLGVPGLEDSLPEGPADVLILPTPCLNQAGRLRGAGEGLDPTTLSGYYDAHTRVYGGALPADLTERLPGCGPITELLSDATLAAVNGRLTAEAAVSLAAERLEGSLFGLDCTVLGYGRIGKPLAELLGNAHARVTVAARREAIRAEAAQRGFAICGFETPPAASAVIFNTVPAQTLDPAALASLGPDCLWVELASVPGGLPAGYVPAFCVLNGNSLPGRRLPRSAAAALLDGIARKELTYET